MWFCLVWAVGESPLQRYGAHFPISCFAFQQPTHTVLHFQMVLVHWSAGLRFSTRTPLPNGWIQEMPAPPAPRCQHLWQAGVTHNQTQPQLCLELSASDSQQLLRVTADPAFESSSSLCFTYNIGADANLCNHMPGNCSHPLVIHIQAYPHTYSTNPAVCF